MTEDDIPVSLPDGTKLPGRTPVVIIGPNGSGKTRLAVDIAKDISDVNQSAEDMSRNSSQVNQNAEQLSKLAEQLNEMVTRLKV